MEASSPYGVKDLARHVFNHVKDAFGCYSMPQSISKKYEYADAKLLETLSVIFLHASGKDNV